MAENSFSGGMKDTMSLFMMSSLAANYDAQRENMEENRELRAANLQRQVREDKRQEFTADMEFLKLASNPATNLPDDVAISRLNTISKKWGFSQQAVSMDEAKAFDAELGQFTSREDLETGEARRAAFQPYSEKIASNVVYARAYNRHAKQIEDYLTKPGALATLQAAGYTKENAKRFIEEVRPGEAMALVKDGDFRKAAILNQANQVIADVTNGVDRADGEISQVLTAAHGAGFKIGVSGAEMIKGTTGEQQLNIAQKDINSLNITSVKPLSKLWGTLDRDKLALSVATVKPNDSLVTVGLDMTDRIASQLPQEQQKAFHESIAKIEAVYTDASRSFKDFQARFKIAKNSPDTSPGERILLQQQYDIEKQKYHAQIAPFMAFKSYTDEPTEANFDKVLKASDKLDNQMRMWESDKANLRTESEKKIMEETLTGKTTRAVKEATNEAGQRFLKMAGENPDLFDADGTMDVSKAGKAFAPVITELNKKYSEQYGIPVQLDGVEVVKELASASKRSVPSSNTLTKLTPEQAAKFETFVAGERLTQEVKTMLVHDGKVDRKLLATALGGGVPWTNGRTLEAYVLDAMEAEYRARTGAAMPEEEVVRAKKIFVPSNLDSDSTIIRKLDNLEQHFGDKINLTDPDGQLRKRLKPMKRLQDKAASTTTPEATPGAPAHQSWDDKMDVKARQLLQAHPDWSTEQLYKALKDEK